MKPWVILLSGILIGLLAAGLILLLTIPDKGKQIELKPGPTPTLTLLPKPSQTPTPIQALIKGQVLMPGEYLIKKDARLSELIEIAGGLTNGADVSRINTVLLVRDGDYFFIPSYGEDIPDTASNAPGKNLLIDKYIFEYPIDLNTASQEALESLPGIGPAKATDIINYREQVGLFETIEDLLNVPGIGKSTLESLINFIKTE